ncbi:MAG: aminoacyl-tRNA hydrolase, partial [Vicinamibacterales bacterium]
MKLIAGLGNPGAKYRETRHNVGFEVVDVLARRQGVDFESAPGEAVMARGRSLGDGVLLVKPLTSM